MVQFVTKHQIVLLVIGIIIMSILLFFMTRNHNALELSRGTTLSESHYDLLQKKLETIINKQDPREAFVLLKRSIKENEEVLASCHVLTHDMGHIAYAKYQDFGKAMSYKQEICNSGYIHGVIESHFDQATDIEQAMLTVCIPYYPGTFTRWQCDHGIGHGVMIATDDNLPKALSLCEKLQSPESRSVCANGAFMENVMADQKNHFSNYLKRNDQFYPCREQKDQYKGSCYGYSPTAYLTLHPGRYEEALIWCQKAEDGYQTSCAQGVGSKAIVETIENPQQIIRTCMLTIPIFADGCLTGVVNEYINHYGALEPAQKLCTEFPKAKKALCGLIVANKAPLFE